MSIPGKAAPQIVRPAKKQLFPVMGSGPSPSPDLPETARFAGPQYPERGVEMILVYTGNGKGKTTACLGQVIRALGRGMRVGFAQFIKKDGEAGEQFYLRQHLGENFLAGGRGFFLNEGQRPEHRDAAENTLAWAKQKMDELDLLILDEILCAMDHGLIVKTEVNDLLELSRKKNCHLILSGRGFPDEMKDDVDLITEMVEIKHHWQKGIPAVKGLDY